MSVGRAEIVIETILLEILENLVITISDLIGQSKGWVSWMMSTKSSGGDRRGTGQGETGQVRTGWWLDSRVGEWVLYLNHIDDCWFLTILVPLSLLTFFNLQSHSKIHSEYFIYSNFDSVHLHLITLHIINSSSIHPSAHPSRLSFDPLLIRFTKPSIPHHTTPITSVCFTTLLSSHSLLSFSSLTSDSTQALNTLAGWIWWSKSLCNLLARFLIETLISYLPHSSELFFFFFLLKFIWSGFCSFDTKSFSKN